jgi:hypothetical protein
LLLLVLLLVCLVVIVLRSMLASHLPTLLLLLLLKVGRGSVCHLWVVLLLLGGGWGGWAGQDAACSTATQQNTRSSVPGAAPMLLTSLQIHNKAPEEPRAPVTWYWAATCHILCCS